MRKKISDFNDDAEHMADKLTARRRKTKQTMRVHGARTRGLSKLIVGRATQKGNPQTK